MTISLTLDPDTSAAILALLTQGANTMSAITDWAAKEQADLTAISGKLQTIADGIAKLDAMIAALQNSPGTLSASDQAALDQIEQQSAALVTAASAIDLTPPTAPPAAPTT